MGAGWANPETFRLGASGLLDAILAELDGASAPQTNAAY
jgi:deoxyribose-phosphate aldolase